MEVTALVQASNKVDGSGNCKKRSDPGFIRKAGHW